jgi:hypothetical protein
MENTLKNGMLKYTDIRILACIWTRDHYLESTRILAQKSQPNALQNPKEPLHKNDNAIANAWQEGADGH